MKWSKLKKRVEENFADSVKGRIEIFTTAYRRQDEISRTWMVIDGKEKVSFTDCASWRNLRAYFHELTPTNCLRHRKIDESERQEDSLFEPGEFSSYDFKIMAFESLNTSAHNCLSSEHPILRCLGVLHQKTGKTRVKAMREDKHPLVAFLAEFRYMAECS
ncbi:SF0329 family protein [Microbulbifer sp. DLAB2-AA]|uniref:SF0329 family protein n=1 Tax=Microbulbifer sp. DLAB2-AA TaxID=3243394 RepID=UPI00403A6ACA